MSRLGSDRSLGDDRLGAAADLVVDLAAVGLLRGVEAVEQGAAEYVVAERAGDLGPGGVGGGVGGGLRLGPQLVEPFAGRDAEHRLLRGHRDVALGVAREPPHRRRRQPHGDADDPPRQVDRRADPGHLDQLHHADERPVELAVAHPFEIVAAVGLEQVIAGDPVDGRGPAGGALGLLGQRAEHLVEVRTKEGDGAAQRLPLERGPSRRLARDRLSQRRGLGRAEQRREPLGGAGTRDDRQAVDGRRRGAGHAVGQGPRQVVEQGRAVGQLVGRDVDRRARAADHPQQQVAAGVGVRLVGHGHHDHVGQRGDVEHGAEVGRRRLGREVGGVPEDRLRRGLRRQRWGIEPVEVQQRQRGGVALAAELLVGLARRVLVAVAAVAGEPRREGVEPALAPRRGAERLGMLAEPGPALMPAPARPSRTLSTVDLPVFVPPNSATWTGSPSAQPGPSAGRTRIRSCAIAYGRTGARTASSAAGRALAPSAMARSSIAASRSQAAGGSSWLIGHLARGGRPLASPISDVKPQGPDRRSSGTQPLSDGASDCFEQAPIRERSRP